MIRAATPGGLYSNLIEQPSDRIGVWTRVEHRLTRAQAIRVDVGRTVDEAQNQGIGEFDLPERGFTSKESVFEVQVGHHTTGRRYENDFRFSLVSSGPELSSVSDARTIRVLDAFTSGGAQQQGGHRSRAFEFEHELQFTARGHKLTTGSFINGAYYQGDQYSNASGTYTFASLASFEAGKPTTFTQRLGDRNATRSSMHRFGWYAAGRLSRASKSGHQPWCSPRFSDASPRLGEFRAANWRELDALAQGADHSPCEHGGFLLPAGCRNLSTNTTRHRSPAMGPRDLQPRLSGSLFGRCDAGNGAAEHHPRPFRSRNAISPSLHR